MHDTDRQLLAHAYPYVNPAFKNRPDPAVQSNPDMIAQYNFHIVERGASTVTTPSCFHAACALGDPY